MPMSKGGNKVSNDIEFAGQSLDQKRKSIKAMSKIVQGVDESGDLEDVKPRNFIVNDGAQLQSMVSIQQVQTDADEPTPKNQHETS